MDDFREWLSDNLRYIMLGVGIILVLVLIFFGIRFISNLVGTDVKDSEIQTEQDVDAVTETPTPTPEETPEISTALEKNAVPEVFTLMGTYYNAIVAKDVEAMKGIVDNFTAEDEAVITSNTVEAYSNINVYTKAYDEKSYVTFASYKYKLSGIGTLVPGISQFYVCTNDDGSVYICTAAPDADVQAFIDETVKSTEVQDIVNEVQAEFDAALASDPVLNAYFNPDAATTEETTDNTTEDASAEAVDASDAESEDASEPEPTPEPEYETVTLKKSANFRDAPSNNSNVIQGIKKGTEMLKLGEEGGWFHVRIDGVDGYIAARFF